MIARLRRDERGIGLIELVIAIAVLNIVLLALFGAFNAGAFAVQRAGVTSTAEVLADKQMELYRAHLYGSIGLHSGLVSAAAADATHTGDTAWVSAGSQLVSATCTTALDECKPVQASVTGPDNRTYRIDTYARQLTSGAGGPTNGRAVKQVTVVVRRTDTGKVLTRLTTTFDRSTGCTGVGTC